MSAEILQTFRFKGAEGVVAAVLDLADLAERRDLIFAAHREIGKGDGHQGNLDGYVAVIRFGLDEILRQASLEANADESDKLTDRANILCYNFSATLAECWGSDAFPRSERHRREGLLAAERCLAWRRQLGKGPRPFAMAWWAKGVHELTLGRITEAAASFAESSKAAAEAAPGEDAKPIIAPGGYYFYMLAEGYRGLALGQDELFDAVVSAFQAGLTSDNEEIREDAEFGSEQLRCMKSRL